MTITVIMMTIRDGKSHGMLHQGAIYVYHFYSFQELTCNEIGNAKDFKDILTRIPE